MLSFTAEQIANYGLWIQSVALIVTAVGIIITIIWSKRIACRRATLDLLLLQQTDQGTINSRTEFTKLRDEGHLSKWAEPDNTHSKHATTLRAILNKYELIAIGLQQGILDEKFYKKWHRTTLVKDWIECKPFVMQIRQNSKVPTFFCEFE